jgi:hypothetical protein
LTYARIFLANIGRGDVWEAFRLAAVGIGWPIALGSLPWHVVMAFAGYGVGIRVHWRLHTIKEKKKISQSERRAEENRPAAE